MTTISFNKKHNNSFQEDVEIERKYMSIRDAAKVTGLSEYCIRNKIKANEIPYIKSGIKYCYNKYSKEMGIPVKSSHKARKTYISSLYSEGVNLNTIRALVGHTDERTTLHNYCFDRSESTEKIKLIERALSK